MRNRTYVRTTLWSLFRLTVIRPPPDRRHVTSCSFSADKDSWSPLFVVVVARWQEHRRPATVSCCGESAPTRRVGGAYFVASVSRAIASAGVAPGERQAALGYDDVGHVARLGSQAGENDSLRQSCVSPGGSRKEIKNEQAEAESGRTTTRHSLRARRFHSRSGAWQRGPGGEDRAEYGKKVVKELSERLTERYGKGFSVQVLWSISACFFRLILTDSEFVTHWVTNLRTRQFPPHWEEN